MGRVMCGYTSTVKKETVPNAKKYEKNQREKQTSSFYFTEEKPNGGVT